MDLKSRNCIQSNVYNVQLQKPLVMAKEIPWKGVFNPKTWHQAIVYKGSFIVVKESRTQIVQLQVKRGAAKEDAGKEVRGLRGGFRREMSQRWAAALADKCAIYSIRGFPGLTLCGTWADSTDGSNPGDSTGANLGLGILFLGEITECDRCFREHGEKDLGRSLDKEQKELVRERIGLHSWAPGVLAKADGELRAKGGIARVGCCLVKFRIAVGYGVGEGEKRLTGMRSSEQNRN
nr:hypothetical protein Iba_chr11bCG10680 [Ipomoea batatas]